MQTSVGDAVSGASDMSDSFGQVSAASQETRLGAEESPGAARDMEAVARELVEVMAQFRVD